MNTAKTLYKYERIPLTRRGMPRGKSVCLVWEHVSKKHVTHVLGPREIRAVNHGAIIKTILSCYRATAFCRVQKPTQLGETS